MNPQGLSKFFSCTTTESFNFQKINKLMWKLQTKITCKEIEPLNCPLQHKCPTSQGSVNKTPHTQARLKCKFARTKFQFKETTKACQHCKKKRGANNNTKFTYTQTYFETWQNWSSKRNPKQKIECLNITYPSTWYQVHPLYTPVFICNLHMESHACYKWIHSNYQGQIVGESIM